MGIKILLVIAGFFVSYPILEKSYSEMDTRDRIRPDFIKTGKGYHYLKAAGFDKKVLAIK